jgi:hypothetical protein
MKRINLLVISLLGIAASGQTIRLNEQSDWWSMNNEKELILIKVELQQKTFDTNNLKILDLPLDTLSFDQAAEKLGQAIIVNRGDASYSRSQVCYVSSTGPQKIHLIFEGGEGESSTFYLFRGGADWKGSNLCAKSNLVSADLTTGTGLRLGLSRTQVESILGKPDSASGNRIAYCRELPKESAISIQIEARFDKQGMNYLLVSTTSHSKE